MQSVSENNTKLYVSFDKAKEGSFASVTEALCSIPKENRSPVTILIAPGRYHEKITVDRPFVTLEGTGQNSSDTVLTFDDYANDMMEDGTKRGTFRSYSVFVDANDVILKNLTIENASGDSLTHGQAIALYADGDRLIVDSCRLLGHQDTLFTAPLPPKEIQKNGFIGPKQSAPRLHRRQYYKNCYICGDIDFIFGGATAYFENCTIESLRHFPEETGQAQDGHIRAGQARVGQAQAGQARVGQAQAGQAQAGHVQGYVTAASTPEDKEYGYVFSNCKLISEECPDGTVYLGRPWRNYARTVFLDCSFGKHIHPELFHDWNKPEARSTILYALSHENLPEEYPDRADFVQEVKAEQLAFYTKEKVLAGEDGWKPES